MNRRKITNQEKNSFISSPNYSPVCRISIKSGECSFKSPSSIKSTALTINNNKIKIDSKYEEDTLIDFNPSSQIQIKKMDKNFKPIEENFSFISHVP